MLFLNLLIDGISTGCLYALVAIGFSLIWWLSDILHLAHGGVIIAAGYAGQVLITRYGFPLWAASLAALAVAIVLGVLIERAGYQTLLARGSGELGILTASLGILICLEYGLTLAFGSEGIRLDPGSARTPLLTDSALILDLYTIAVIATTGVIFAGLVTLMRGTQFGKNMRAAAENRSLAHVLGINVRRVTIGASVLASVVGVPAAMIFLYDRGLQPHDAIHIVLIAAIVAIFGGRGSIVGALVAGLVIGIAESVMVWFFDAGWREIVTFALLYALLLVRPEGLFGRARG